MRKMGGLFPLIKITWLMMLIGNLALTGVPFTAGFYSKDAIIEASYASGWGFAFTLLVLAAFCTSFYSWRLAFMTFHGTSRADQETIDHVHESPAVMLVPLYVLAIGAIAAGFAFKDYFIGHEFKEFWHGAVAENEIMHTMHEVPTWVVWSPFVAMVAGLALAFLFYIRNTALPRKLAEQHWPVYKFLLNKWYFDELYDLIFVRPAMWLGRFLWKKGDGFVIDGFGPDGVASTVNDVTRGVVRLQTGYVYHYAFAMMIGVAVLISWFLFGGAH
jgi:NADH-quinone oxidoreductase subunit L